MKRTRHVLFVGLATGVHFIVSIPFFLYAIGMGMSGFGEVRPPTAGESLVTSISMVLLAPFSLVDHLIPASWFPGRWFYVLLLSNSLVWGLFICVLHGAYRRWRLSRKAG